MQIIWHAALRNSHHAMRCWFCLNRRLWLAKKICVCLFICKSSPMIHCGNRSFLEVTWQMFENESRLFFLDLLEPWDVRDFYIRKTADLPMQLCLNVRKWKWNDKMRGSKVKSCSNGV
jgi:hypothetical protein